MNGLRWSADNVPECLKDYDGQFALTLWYKAVSNMFRTNCPIGRHFRSFKFHQNSFVASEAVTWLQEQLKTDRFKVEFTREQTLALIQTMQRLEKMFTDVRGKPYDIKQIRDNGALYRFCDYQAFGDWGLPCENNDQICAVEVASGINCSSSYSRIKEVKAEKTNSIVQEQEKELYHSPKSCRSNLAPTIAPSHSFDEETLTRELFSSPAFRNVNFTPRSSAEVTGVDSRKAPRGCAPRLSAHEAALEEKWPNRCNDLPSLHRRNTASRTNNSWFPKTGEDGSHRKSLQSFACSSRKEFVKNAALRERSNEPLARVDSASRYPGLPHEAIWTEFQSFDPNFSVHSQLSRNQPAETSFLANNLFNLRQMRAIQTDRLRNDLGAHKMPFFEPIYEPEMEFESLFKSDSYLSPANSAFEQQILLDFNLRLRNLLDVNDLNSVFDVSAINLTNLMDNLYETGFLARDEELFPRYMLEVLQSLVNWPMGEVSIGSRCLAHTFYFMENYFTCVINPLFTYKLYPVFAGVIGSLRRRSKRQKTCRADNKENPLSQKNQYCMCPPQVVVFGQSTFDARGSDVTPSSHHHNSKLFTPFSSHNESFVSPTCLPCSILSEDFSAQGSKRKKKIQDGITLPRNPALESYLRRKSPAEMDTSGDTLLSVSSAESNELYETALCSFHESDDAFSFVDEPIQADVPVGSTSDDCGISYSEGVELASFNSFFDDISEADLVESLQLCCLLLSPLERQRIRLFLDAIRKIVSNVNVAISGGGCRCKQMALRLATALFRSQDATQQDLQLASSLTAFFFRYGERILESPKQCETAHSQCQCAHCHSVLENSCDCGSASYEVPVTYCSRITRDEYKRQSVRGTKAELRKLLEDIINNKPISAKVKNNQLKKFEKAYPDIYHERFPVTAIPRARPSSFRKSLNLLRNLRI